MKWFMIEFYSDNVYHPSQAHIFYDQCPQFLSYSPLRQALEQTFYFSLSLSDSPSLSYFFFLLDNVVCTIVNDGISCISLYLLSSNQFLSKVINFNYHCHYSPFFAPSIVAEKLLLIL